MSDSSTTSSIGLGNIIAVVVSWHVNHSIFWAFIHGILGWIYIIYYVICIRSH